MKATELRLGNYLIQSNHTGTVQRIDFDGAILQMNEINISGDVLDIDLSLPLKPISLTEEWLVNFGFDRSSVRGDKHFYKQVADRFLRLSIGDFWNVHIGQAEIKYYEIPVNIKYVHQLQNLYFALTGEELTIKE